MELWLREEFAKKWEGKDAFAKVDALEGEVFRNVKNRRTLRFEQDGKGYFAKIHHGVGWGEILKNLVSFRLPILGAENEWHAIAKLQKLGVATMTAVGYGNKGLNPATRHSFILTEALDDTVSLEDYCGKWPSSPPNFVEKIRLIRQVARTSKLLHENGVCHRDFYICHFLLHDAEAFSRGEILEPKLSLIDLHRALIHRKLHKRWIVKDVAGLYFSALHIGLSTRDFLRFAKLYSGKSLRQIQSEDGDFWTLVKKKAFALDAKINAVEGGST
ncbi:MAG: lipopolysaccharide core heptose(I) kinase RfaP [Pseudohongiellaceae bacterium]|nr:lipopolysaccharide core heptose(I) kinase RfaP [Pseudohongiellaceae bacterium]